MKRDEEKTNLFPDQQLMTLKWKIKRLKIRLWYLNKSQVKKY